MSQTQGKIKVTLVKSMVGTRRTHRDSVRGLGLKRLNQSVVLEDSPAVHGMIQRVNYLVKSETV